MAIKRVYPTVWRHRRGSVCAFASSFYIPIIIALFLSACGSLGPDTAPLGAGAPPPLSESAGQNAAISEVIFVVPPKGAAPQTGLILADAIAAELRDRNHPAILAFQPNQAGASIVGEVAAAEPNGNVIWLAIDWSVRAPYGTLMDTYRQQVVIDEVMWVEGGAEAINLLVGDAAPRVLDMVRANVGPPMLAAMRRPPPPKTPSDELFGDSAIGQAATPANVDELADANANVAPEPLARIAETTNGRVILADGMDQSANAEMSSLDVVQQVAPTAVNAPAPVSAPPADIGAGRQAETSPRPPLPSLLEDPIASAPVVSPSAPPQPLVPGVPRSVAPPPGGVAPIQDAAATNDDGTILDALSPNMDIDARRPGDARPDPEDEIAFSQVRWGQPAFLIRPVNGASGNGNQALTAGLKSALRARDLTISEDPRQAGFVVDGDVDMGPAASGRQYVRITWRVSTIAGDEVGRAVQENTVIAGSLDGEWGQVAKAVSNAAVRGIQDLFGSAETRQATREPLPSFPEIDLPEIPGRAPPPPTGY